MRVEYNINPIDKPRLDEIVAVMVNAHPPEVLKFEELKVTKHYFIGGKEIIPENYDFEDYGDYKIPKLDEVCAYVLANGWHMTFNAEEFYRRCENKKWCDKQGERFKRWTNLLNATKDRGWCAGQTPFRIETDSPLPESIIKRRTYSEGYNRNDNSGDSY